MASEPPFSDEELTAYLDGEADDALRVRVDAERENAAVAERLRALSIDVDQLTDAFDQTLKMAPTPGFLEPLQSVPRRRAIPNPALQAIAAAVLLAVGWSAGHFGKPDAPETWRDYAATYHALYVTETLSGDEASPSALAAQVTRVSGILEKALTVDALSGVEGLDLRRAQILAFKDNPLVQIAYLTDDGVPMALCLFRKSGKKAAVTVTERLGMASAHWSDGKFGYLLIGGADESVVRDAATAFSNRL